MPGLYSVRVTVPGTKAPLTGKITVEADPLPKFSGADRLARQATLMKIHDWTRALGEARAAARALVSQRDAIKADVGATADSLNARIARASSEIDRALTDVSAQRAPIENWSGPPSIDQGRSLGYAVEDAEKAVAELNKLTGADIPAAYKVAAKEWGSAVKRVAVPARGAGAGKNP